MPLLVLPEMRFPAPGTVPPMRLLFAVSAGLNRKA